MNDNDVNELIKKAQSMIQNNQIPDDIKSMINNFQKSNNSNNTSYSNSYNYSSSNNKTNNNKSNTTANKSNQNNNDIPNIDIQTLMKIQDIMSKMKNSENDDMSKLLLSLKPYLRNGRKDKIDEYIKLIQMGKLTQLFENLGGDKN